MHEIEQDYMDQMKSNYQDKVWRLHVESLTANQGALLPYQNITVPICKIMQNI